MIVNDNFLFLLFFGFHQNDSIIISNDDFFEWAIFYTLRKTLICLFRGEQFVIRWTEK